jgi:hypothetical protein
METVGFIPELEMKVVSPTPAHYRAHLIHACYRLLLSPIKNLQKHQKGISFYNAASGKIENFLPLLGELQGDTPEKQSATGVLSGGTNFPCYKCCFDHCFDVFGFANTATI